MHPIVKAAAALAIVQAASSAAGDPARAATGRAPSAPDRPSPVAACPPGTLPDAGVCIPVPSRGAGGPDALLEEGAHREKSGRWRLYDHIPRRPDRPQDWRRYRYPIELDPRQNLAASGYDLGLPDAHQRRGEHLGAVGHGGIDLAQKRGTEVRLVALEHQVGDADVVFVGEIFGNSVVTRHAVREGGKLREYVVLHGHLEGPAPGLAKGVSVREGSLVGFVGDSGSPGAVHLHLELRRVRDGVNVAGLLPAKLAQSAYTVVCDPRNALPLAGG